MCYALCTRITMINKPRFQAIYSLITRCDTIADIGADHGKVAHYIAKSNLCKTLIVNDISPHSLQKAKIRLDVLKSVDNIKSSTALPNIKFIVCCGSELAAHIDTPIDCAIIAGIGGKEILKIVTGLMPKSAILSPQKNADITKTALKNLGYTIEKDLEIIDDRRKYAIFKINS